MTSPGSAFSAVAHWTARQMGRGSSFALACLTVLAWAASGPVFGFSDTWQLVINTGTTIVTFLMVFLLQHAQNRDSAAIQLKLDELIRLSRDARGRMLALEGLSAAELDQVKAALLGLADPAEARLDGAPEARDEAGAGVARARGAVARLREPAP